MENVDTTYKTHPNFVAAWTAMLTDRRVVRATPDVSPTDYGDLDDFSRFDRPRRRTRPRTKDRPTYDDAVSGLVVTVDGDASRFGATATSQRS